MGNKSSSRKNVKRVSQGRRSGTGQKLNQLLLCSWKQTKTPRSRVFMSGKAGNAKKKGKGSRQRASKFTTPKKEGPNLDIIEVLLPVGGYKKEFEFIGAGVVSDVEHGVVGRWAQERWAWKISERGSSASGPAGQRNLNGRSVNAFRPPERGRGKSLVGNRRQGDQIREETKAARTVFRRNKEKKLGTGFGSSQPKPKTTKGSKRDLAKGALISSTRPGTKIRTQLHPAGTNVGDGGLKGNVNKSRW